MSNLKDINGNNIKEDGLYSIRRIWSKNDDSVWSCYAPFHGRCVEEAVKVLQSEYPDQDIQIVEAECDTLKLYKKTYKYDAKQAAPSIDDALKTIASITPEEVDLDKHTLLYTTIRSNYEVACTAQYVEENFNVPKKDSFIIATLVREEMEKEPYAEEHMLIQRIFAEYCEETNTAYLVYNNGPYRVRRLPEKGRADYIIGDYRLQSALLDESGNYTSEEARDIDEQIYFFVSEDDIYKDTISLTDLVRKETA